jgi:hypothetical protein
LTPSVAPAAASASFVAPAAVASFVTPVPADPQATPSGPFAAPAGSHAAAPPGSTEPRRIAWPLVAVIAGAAVVGSVAVLLMMRSGSLTVTSAASAPERPIRPIVESIDPEPVRPAALAAEASAPAADPGSPIGAETAASALMAAPVVARDGSPAHGAAAVALKAAPRVPRGSPGSPPLRASDARDRAPDELSRLYEDGHYDLVVAQCGKGAIVIDRVPLCFLAACRVGDEAVARRLVAQVPAPRRERLVTNCKQFGLDIHDEGCEADPMSCQH